MTKLSVDHVLRPPLPWATTELTECGHDPANFGDRILTRDQLKMRANDWGRERTYMTTCVTCLQTAQRWPTFEDDPPQALGRVPAWGKHSDLAKQELLAVAELIARHRDEFVSLVGSIASTSSLADARQARATKARQTR